MRLLIATEFPPNASGGGPAVVRQMLRDWPAGEIMWWSCRAEEDTRFQFTYERHFAATIPPKLMPHFRLTRPKAMLIECLWHPWAKRHLARVLRSSGADVVWAIPHNWSILPLASNLPGGTTGYHVTIQDYVDVHGQMWRFGRGRCRRMVSLADRLYAESATRDATSHPMLADLLQRTGKAGAQVLHAGVEDEDLLALRNKRRPETKSIRIAYAGTILVHSEFGLFVEALRRVRQSLDVPITLEFFGSHSYASVSWFDASWMCEWGEVPEPELLENLRNCTWGFVPMGLRDLDPQYNRFSFPTKFITYLAAGLPVLTLGHPESTVMRMARNYEVGHASCANTVEQLSGELLLALNERRPWERYASEIMRCATVEFNATSMRRTLYKCLEICAEVTRIQRAAIMRR